MAICKYRDVLRSDFITVATSMGQTHNMLKLLASAREMLEVEFSNGKHNSFVPDVNSWTSDGPNAVSWDVMFICPIFEDVAEWIW